MEIRTPCVRASKSDKPGRTASPLREINRRSGGQGHRDPGHQQPPAGHGPPRRPGWLRPLVRLRLARLRHHHPPPGNGFFGAGAINDAGQVLGHADVGGDFLFDGLSWTPIPDVPGAVSPLANGLNNLGPITGFHIPAAGEPARGVLPNDGAFTTFDAPGAVGGTVGLALDDSDQLVGYCGTGAASPPTQHQAFLDEAGSFTDLEMPIVAVAIDRVVSWCRSRRVGAASPPAAPSGVPDLTRDVATL